MKRIYTTLGLIGAAMGFSATSHAQVADLTPVIYINNMTCLNARDTLQPDQNNQSQPYGIWGAVNNGPDAVDSQQNIMYMFPLAGFTYPTDSTISYSYFLGTTQFYAPTDSLAWIGSYGLVDSIKSLIDIDRYDSLFNAGYPAKNALFSSLLNPTQLQEGGTYGFYLYIMGLGDDPNAPDNIDTVGNNDVDYVPIVWHCESGTGINEMIEEAAQHINIFPNPAQNELHFKYGFIKATAQATARVIDMTGRVILTKELGQQQFGTKEFDMNISSLSAGNYLLEISTGYMNAVGKFTVQK